MGIYPLKNNVSSIAPSITAPSYAYVCLYMVVFLYTPKHDRVVVIALEVYFLHGDHVEHIKV